MTLSFNLAPGARWASVTRDRAGEAESVCPQRSTAAFRERRGVQSSLANEPLLILAALVTVYIVLGDAVRELHSSNHDSFDAAFGGRGAFWRCCSSGPNLSVIALIGIILLIGIVKKNAIMMIDFALVAERSEGKSPEEAIYRSMPAAFPADHDDHHGRDARRSSPGAGTGNGSELRRPLGITIVGGLIVSQMLTLFTTPVVYLYMDRMRLRFRSVARIKTKNGLVQPT